MRYVFGVFNNGKAAGLQVMKSVCGLTYTSKTVLRKATPSKTTTYKSRVAGIP